MSKHTSREKEFQDIAMDTDPLLTVHEVAQRLRVDDTTVRRWITKGILDAVHLPHKNERQAYRIRQSTLSTLLQEGTQHTSEEGK